MNGCDRKNIYLSAKDRIETAFTEVESMKYGAVIVAAGMSTRMKEFKQLMKIDDMTFAERVITNFQRAGVRDIAIVTGYRGDELEKSLRGSGVVFLRNENYEKTQMFDSALIGLKYLKDRCDSIFFCPVDVPFFMEETVRSLMRESEKADVIVPFYNGRKGHPIILSKNAINYICKYDGEGGLRGAYEKLRSDGEGTLLTISVDDNGAIMDADTKEDYRKLIELHNSRLIRAEVSVSLCNAKSFFDRHTVNLFRQIDAIGNVREACEKCGISYSKGWGLLHECEEQLGYRVVERQQGGKEGGASSLTDKGRKLVERYEEFEKEMSEIGKQKFDEIFNKGEWLKKEKSEI